VLACFFRTRCPRTFALDLRSRKKVKCAVPLHALLFFFSNLGVMVAPPPCTFQSQDKSHRTWWSYHPPEVRKRKTTTEYVVVLPRPRGCGGTIRSSRRSKTQVRGLETASGTCPLRSICLSPKTITRRALSTCIWGWITYRAYDVQPLTSPGTTYGSKCDEEAEDCSISSG
jgi:hypothetical protein